MPKALFQHSPACNAGKVQVKRFHSVGMVQDFEACLQHAVYVVDLYLGFYPRLC